MMTQASRIAYIQATFNRMAKDRHYSQAQAAADIERTWAEDIDEQRSDAAQSAAFNQSFYVGG